jgi:hypothetical protein
LNGATVQGRAIVVNKSEPKPEGERRSLTITVVVEIHAVVMVEIAVVRKPWWWKQRRILISHSTTIKKGVNVN